MSDDLNINDGNQNPAWMSQLPDALKSNETLSKFQNLGDLGSKFLEVDGEVAKLNDKLGNTIPKLSENASDVEKAAFFKSLGVPEKAEEYDIQKPDLPEGIPYDETLEQKFRQTAHSLGCTPAQVKGIYDMFLGYNVGIHQQVVKGIEENREKAKTTLQNIWKGDAFPQNKEKATKTFFKIVEAAEPPPEFGGKDGMRNWFDENGLGDAPQILWLFSRIHDLISDDGFVQGSFGGTKEIQRTAAGTPMLEFPSMQKQT